VLSVAENNGGDMKCMDGAELALVLFRLIITIVRVATAGSIQQYHRGWGRPRLKHWGYATAAKTAWHIRGAMIQPRVRSDEEARLIAHFRFRDAQAVQQAHAVERVMMSELMMASENDKAKSQQLPSTR
jgi:hypothetical protein